MVKHRRERNVQIFLPVFAAAALVVLLVTTVLIAYFSQNPQVAKWAATASIIIFTVILALMLILFLVLVALIVLNTIALRRIPQYTGNFSEQFLHYSALSRRYMDKAVGPMIAIESWLKVPGDLLRRKRKGS
jgi:ATP/ADP translocase